MDTPVLFNNCNGRSHAELFDQSNAFFDLNTFGVQANKAINLRVGTVCIVAQRPTSVGDVRFDRYSFESERLMTDPESGEDVRVLFGVHLDSETLPKPDAAKHSLYSDLFTVNGDFKQVSVVEA